MQIMVLCTSRITNLRSIGINHDRVHGAIGYFHFLFADGFRSRQLDVHLFLFWRQARLLFLFLACHYSYSEVALACCPEWLLRQWACLEWVWVRSILIIRNLKFWTRGGVACTNQMRLCRARVYAPRVVSQGYKIRDPGIPDRRSSGAELNHRSTKLGYGRVA